MPRDNRRDLRRGWRVLAAIGGLMLIGAVGRPADAADETMDRLTAARVSAAAIQGYRADFTLTVVEGTTPTTLTGTIQYQRPNQRRIEFTGGASNDEVAQLVVSNETSEWQYFPEKKTVYKTDWAAARAAGASPEALELRGLHQPFLDMKPGTIRLVEQTTKDGQPLLVFEAEPAEALVAEAPFTPGTLRVTVGAQDGLTRLLTMTDRDGREVLSQTYTAIQTPGPLDAALFEFTPPEGVEVVDISTERGQAGP